MKKFKSTLYWIGVLVSYLVAFTFFGIIVALALDFPDTMLGGMGAWALIIVGLVFAADDEERDILKKLIMKTHKHK